MVVSHSLTAIQLRTKTLAAIADGTVLVDEIEVAEDERDEWFWAKGNSNEHKLTKQMKDMQSKITVFARQFLALEPAKLRKDNDKDFLERELIKFMEAKDAVAAVSSTVSWLQARTQVTVTPTKRQQNMFEYV